MRLALYQDHNIINQFIACSQNKKRLCSVCKFVMQCASVREKFLFGTRKLLLSYFTEVPPPKCLCIYCYIAYPGVQRIFLKARIAFCTLVEFFFCLAYKQHRLKFILPEQILLTLFCLWQLINPLQMFSSLSVW